MFRKIKLTYPRTTLTARSFHNSSTVTNAKTQQSTKDDSEISKFDNMADIWWGKDAPNALQLMNAIRVPFIRDGLKHRGLLDPKFVDSSMPLKNMNIIDVGCGGGILCEPLSQLGANVTGIDASDVLIKIARHHSTNNYELKNKINYIHGLLEDIVADNRNKFDAVVSSECVEHVASVELFLKSCVDVLKPGGSLFLTTMNRTNNSWLFGIIVAEYILNIVPRGTHEWEKFVPPQEVQKILENNNCQTRAIHGFMFNIFRNKWFWTQNTSMNYALHAVKNS